MQAVLCLYIIRILAPQSAAFHFVRGRHSADCLLPFCCCSKPNTHRAKAEAPSSLSRDNPVTSVSLEGKEAKNVQTNANLEEERRN